MEILNDFGIEPILLLAQLVNFIILLFILKRFLYKPILKVLEERKKRVEASIKQAEEIQKKFDSSAKKSEELVNKGRDEASRIIDEAKEEAKILSAQIQVETREGVQNTIRKTQDSLELEKQKMVAEARKQVVDMVVSVTEKVVSKTLTGADRERLVQESVRELKK
jgi:F-type H+-transporting ATPase subunit b